MHSMTEVFLASGNKHKCIEFQSFLREVSIKTPADIGMSFTPIENGNSFFENAMIKAQALYEVLQQPVLADDSGLCVTALHDAPGIYSSRYAGEHANGPEQDKKNIEKLLHDLAETKSDDRSAYFVACIILYLEKNRFFVSQEICKGEIVSLAQGTNGFGYDPIFFIPNLGKTMAELSLEEKNKCSHRAKALVHMQKIIAGVF